MLTMVHFFQKCFLQQYKPNNYINLVTKVIDSQPFTNNKFSQIDLHSWYLHIIAWFNNLIHTHMSNVYMLAAHR